MSSRAKFDGCTCGNAETLEHLPGCPVRPFAANPEMSDEYDFSNAVRGDWRPEALRIAMRAHAESPEHHYSLDQCRAALARQEAPRG